jgi:5-methylcytosine-specific restriction endonuclease McrA
MSSKTIELTRFTPDEVIGAYYNTKVIKYGGSSLDNPRLANFMINGLSCVKCGIRGNVFISERQRREQIKPHLNLYMIGNKEKVLLTRDHIKPRKHGGLNCLHNYQPMCERCNKEKSADYSIKDRAKHLISLVKYKFRKGHRSHIEECNCSIFKAFR